MKSFLILILISGFVHAQRSAPQASPSVLRAATTAAATLSQPVAPQVSCDPITGNPLAPYCQDLFASVCSVRETSTQLSALNSSIYGNTYGKLPANATQAQRNAAAEQAIRLSDGSYDNNSSAGLSRDDVRRLMDPARWNVVNLFNGVGTSPSPAAQRLMASTVQNIHLVSGSEYVNSLIQWGRQQNPGANAETLRQNALTTYTAACGQTGLERNAFFEDGNVVLCPGLAYSMRDFGAENGIQEMKAAMIFTMSHEITHSIDYMVNANNYTNLIACYQRTSPDPSMYSNRHMMAELTSDFYGAYALGKYLQDQRTALNLGNPGSPEQATKILRILARSVGAYCTEVPGDTDHPQGRFRLNQVIAQTPSIKKCPRMSCSNE